MTKKRHQRKRIILRTLTLIAFVIFLAAAITIWIFNIEHVISGDWSSILPAVFLVLAVLLAFLQWFFPLSPKEPELTSNVTLIDASLDPNDSPYEQTIENGRLKIRYKEQKPRERSK